MVAKAEAKTDDAGVQPVAEVEASEGGGGGRGTAACSSFCAASGVVWGVSWG